MKRTTHVVLAGDLRVKITPYAPDGSSGRRPAVLFSVRGQRGGDLAFAILSLEEAHKVSTTLARAVREARQEQQP